MVPADSQPAAALDAEKGIILLKCSGVRGKHLVCWAGGRGAGAASWRTGCLQTTPTAHDFRQATRVAETTGMVPQ